MLTRLLATLIGLVLTGSYATAGAAGTAAVTVSASQVTYQAGETLLLEVAASKAEDHPPANLFAGVLLPDGDTVVLVANDTGSLTAGSQGRPEGWVAALRGGGGAWSTSLAPAATYTFSGAEPAGCYVGFVALVGDKGQVLATATTSFSTGTSFVFDDAVSDEERHRVRNAVTRAACFFADRGLGHTGPLTLYALGSIEELIRVYAAHLERLGVAGPEAWQEAQAVWTSGASAVVTGPGAIFFNVHSEDWQRSARQDALADVVLHEMFHAVQERLAEGRAPGLPEPHWLREGSAAYVQWLATEGAPESEARRAWTIEQARATKASLRSLETWDGFFQAGPDLGHGVAFAAIEFLVRETGLAALRTFFGSIGAGQSRDEAFRSAFGRDVETFYGQFEVYRTQL